MVVPNAYSFFLVQDQVEVITQDSKEMIGLQEIHLAIVSMQRKVKVRQLRHQETNLNKVLVYVIQNFFDYPTLILYVVTWLTPCITYF